MGYEKKKLVNIGGLWFKETPGAGKFLSGKIGRIPPGVEIKEGDQIFIFVNKKPTQEKSPTHFLMMVDSRDSGQQESHYRTNPPPREEGGGFGGFEGPQDDGDPGPGDEGAPF